jgi:hypothetical protein
MSPISYSYHQAQSCMTRSMWVGKVWEWVSKVVVWSRGAAPYPPWARLLGAHQSRQEQVGAQPS